MSRQDKKKARRKSKRIEKKKEQFAPCYEFERIFSAESIFRASIECEENVRWKEQVQRYKLQRLHRSMLLSEEVLNGTWRKSKPKRFVINERGKRREISGVRKFTDRIVMHLLCEEVLIPMMFDSIVYDNTASQKGKGPEIAKERFRKHLKQGFGRWGKEACVLQYDYSSFFATISAKRCVDMMMNRIELYAPDGAQGRRAVEFYKELIEEIMLEEDFLGLGNRTSQVGAVVFPSRIEHMLREIHGCGLSGRYMDDGYVVCPDFEAAVQILGELDKVSNRLGLTLNRKKTHIRHINESLPFLKDVFRFNDDGAFMRRVSSATKRNYLRKHIRIRKAVGAGKVPGSVIAGSIGSFGGIAARDDNPAQVLEWFSAYRRWRWGDVGGANDELPLSNGH